MRIAYHYGSLAGGGVERRMADLYRHLTRRGDEVWIVALSLLPAGRNLLCEQGGVPEERILCAPPNTPFDNSYHLWSYDALKELKPDIIDVQWCATPMDYPSTAVATIHGQIPLPTPDLFDGIVFISKCLVLPTKGQPGPVTAIDNWVDLDEYRFHEELPAGGVCFLGREYKAENAEAVARESEGSVIDCYSDTWAQGHQPNMIYKGYADPRELFPHYRVVFASGMAAMESMASGRLTIVGQPSRFTVGDCRLATPERMPGMSASLFAFIGLHGEVDPPTQAQRMQEFSTAIGTEDWLEERRAIRAFLAEYHDAARQIRLLRNFYEEALDDD